MPDRQNFGWDVGPTAYGPRGIIARPHLSMAGNLVLEVGHESTDGEGWFKTTHVVLTPEETAEFVTVIQAQFDD